MNWGQVKALAAKFVHRKDIDWDGLQPLALDDINQQLVVQENEGAASITMSASSLAGFYAGPTPADFAKPRAVFFGGRELESTDIQGLLARGAMTGYFAVSGKQLFANSIGPLSLVYSTRIGALVGDGAQNDLSSLYSPVLLYGLLKHATGLIQDFDAQQSHQAAFDGAIGQANANYVMATLTAGAAPRTPYGQVRN
jgi:hypothetical protein